ncbi:amino acid adenylation domain-containing protein [Nonomuraea sp. NPDC050786]|uniref:non-ribosomal peptide synthetase n=1 Tax=Nonomuraea sp. NPDC050786 TaxID=3154840 RepID=UPI0033C4B336
MTNNVPVVVRMRGAFDVACLELALGDVIGRQERHPLPVSECSPQRLDDRVRAAASVPSGPAVNAPVRASLLRLSPDLHVLLLVLRHDAGELPSIATLLGNLSRAYRMRARGAARAWPSFDYVHTGAPNTNRSREVPFDVPPETHAALLDLARQTRSSLSLVLRAATAAMSSRIGAGGETPLSERLVLRADLSNDTTFRQLVARLRDVGDDWEPALASEPAMGQAGVVLFQGEPAMDLSGVDTRIEVRASTAAGADLAFVMRQRPSSASAAQGISGLVEYAVELFDARTAEALARRFTHCLDLFAAEPDAPLSSMDIRTAAEREVLRAWNDTAVDVPDKTIATIFEERVDTTPDATALVSGAVKLSYRELNAWANRLAHHLIEVGVQPDSLVAVALPRTAEAVVAWLAVAKAGGVYTPIDPQLPIDRIRAVISDARPVALMTTESLARALDDCGGGPVLITEHHQRMRAEHNPTDTDRAGPLLLDHAAYVIYTSGSTGRPKGVTVLHRAVANLWHYHAAVTFPPPATDADRLRVALSASLSFDTSWEGVLAMIAGHELHLLDEVHRRDPARMVAYVGTYGIGQVDVTPSFAQQLVAHGLIADDCAPRTLMLGGEAVGEALWKDLREAPHTTAFNYYGPSEFGVEATGCRLADHDLPTIGRPVSNAQVFVLDEHLNQVPPGTLGEIYLAGANLGRGYLGCPGLTAERFVPNPFGAPGTRMYRSGDLARWTVDGFLTFAGRSDDQVKLRGFRIEPAEIEKAIRTDPAVAEAAVIVREDTPGDKRLVAYLAPVGDATVDIARLRANLVKALPDYMVPAAFVLLDALPLTINAKLDRRALPVPEYGARSTGRPPATTREKVIAGLFAEVLRVDEVSLDDDFFELGGHSLLATRLVARINASLGTGLDLVQLLTEPSVAGVVAVLGAAGARRPIAARTDNS